MLKKIFMLIIMFSMAGSSLFAVSEEELKQLTGKSQDKINPAQYEAIYADAFDFLINKISETKGDQRYKFQIMMQDICAHASRPDAEKQRLTMSKALVQKLEKDGIEPEIRNWIILQIERSGKDEVLDTLQKCLGAKDINERNYAIGALEKNPSVKATDILLTALAKTNDDIYTAGLISALGNRKDAKALKALSGQLDSSNKTVFSAAVTALVKLGTPDSIQAIRNKLSAAKPLNYIAAKGLLDIAAVTKNSNLCKELYTWLENNEQASKKHSIRQAIVTEMAMQNTPGSDDIIIANYENEDPDIKEIAIAAAGAASSNTAALYMADNFHKLNSQQLGQLIIMLAEKKEPDITKPINHAISSGFTETVKIAAEVINNVQTKKTAEILMQFTEYNDAEIRRIAHQAVIDSTNLYVDDLLKAQAVKAEGKQQIDAISLLGERKTSGITEMLFGFAKSDNKEIYAAALASIGNTATYKSIPEICKMVLDSDSVSFRKAGLDAINKILTSSENTKTAYHTIIQEIEKASTKDKIELLSTFKMAADKSAMDYCMTIVINAGDNGIKEPLPQAALKALSSWSNSMPVKGLLDLAKNSDYKAEYGKFVLDLAMNMLRVDKNEAKKIAQAVKDAGIDEAINTKAEKIINLR